MTALYLVSYLISNQTVLLEPVHELSVEHYLLLDVRRWVGSIFGKVRSGGGAHVAEEARSRKNIGPANAGPPDPLRRLCCRCITLYMYTTVPAFTKRNILPSTKDVDWTFLLLVPTSYFAASLSVTDIFFC